MSHPSYNSWTKEKIRLFCEKSIMVVLPKTSQSQTVFQPSPDVAERVLIHGKVTCVSSRDTYEGPCILPSDESLLVHHIEGISPRILEIQGVESDSSLGTTRLQSITEEDISGKLMGNITFSKLTLFILDSSISSKLFGFKQVHLLVYSLMLSL